jgi:predicted DNA-binding transcriptional regulator AlpA
MQQKKLLPDHKVCDRYGVSPMTLWRWDHDAKLNFPQPIRIRGRKYRDQHELDAFDAAQARDEMKSPA